MANYSYAEVNVLFLKESRTFLQVFRIAVLGMVLFGSFATLPLVWALADVAMGVMALLNIAAIVLLSRQAFAVADDFERQLSDGTRPSFTADSVPGIKQGIYPGVW